MVFWVTSYIFVECSWDVLQEDLHASLTEAEYMIEALKWVKLKLGKD
jgi:hypothetical protein